VKKLRATITDEARTLFRDKILPKLMIGTWFSARNPNVPGVNEKQREKRERERERERERREREREKKREREREKREKEGVV
jgi:hypothetical protein